MIDDDGDANNSTVWITRANSKALGIIDGLNSAADASIAFSTDFNWDFDPSDGIDEDHFSFIAVAAHEIGHALGFVSGVDILDGNSRGCGSNRGPFPDDQFKFVSTKDLFRRSDDTLAVGENIVDWTADNRDKHFALGSSTNEAGGFSTGKCFGDGQQASHWKDNLGLGLMDPTIAVGTHVEISNLDIQLFESIGYESVQLIAAGGGLPEDEKGNAISVAMDDNTLIVPRSNSEEDLKFSYSEASNEPIIELSYSGGIIENPDPTPFLQVFGDGVVKVHYPAYMKKAGDYTLRLDQDELSALLQKFSNERVADTPVFDLETELHAGPIDTFVGDHDVVSEVTLNIESIETQSADAVQADPQLDVERTILVPSSDIFSAARSRSQPVNDLAVGVQELESLSSDIRLQRIE